MNKLFLLALVAGVTLCSGGPPPPDTYMGCWKAGGKPMRTLLRDAVSGLNPVECSAACARQGFEYSGSQADKCFCGNQYNQFGRVDDLKCSSRCGDGGLLCGARNVTISVYKTTSLQGCFVHDKSDYPAPLPMEKATMTPQKCVDGCGAHGYAFAGLQEGQCFCGDSNIYQTNVDMNNCFVPCQGDNKQTCGAPNHLQIYTTGSGNAYQGCWTATIPMETILNMTGQTNSAAQCAAMCAQSGYKYAAAKGQNCSCDNQLYTGSEELTERSACNYTCVEGSECGGLTSRSVYSTGSLLGCFKPDTLPVLLIPQAPANTPQLCQQNCRDAGFAYSGVSVGSCHCGHTWDQQLMVPMHDCNVPCPGDQNQKCGRPDGVMNIYATGAGNAYLGCWNNDRSEEGPAMSTNITLPFAANPVDCAASCSRQGYKYSAMQNGKECLCDNGYDKYNQVPESSCNMACVGTSPGTSPHKCGGPNIMSVYATNSLMGCFPDSKNGGLKIVLQNNSAATPQDCSDMCRKAGFPLAGIEWGNKCFCGSADDLRTNSAPMAECDIPCQFDKGLTCGGSQRQQIHKTAPAVNRGPDSIGCFADKLEHHDGLIGAGGPQECIARCKAAGYQLAGARNGNDCYCGKEATAVVNQAKVNDQAECMIPCKGDPTRTCGGRDGTQVYLTGAQAPAGKPTPAPPGGNPPPPPGGSIGCYKRKGLGMKKVYAVENAQECINQCQDQKQGYLCAGVIGGNRCFCGRGQDIKPSNRASDDKCNMQCKDGSSGCGGKKFQQIYPLNQ